MGKFPDAASSLKVLEEEEAKGIFCKYNEEGLIHSIWTGVTPYVVGMCNCDHDCDAYKGYIEMRGAPGSFFTAAGTGFPPNITATVTINSVALGTVPTDGNGDLSFILSTANTDEGAYVVTASVNPTASARFILDADDPVRPQEGEGPIFEVPAGVAFTEFVFLPIIMR